jgi:hypothetical protein
MRKVLIRFQIQWLRVVDFSPQIICLSCQSQLNLAGLAMLNAVGVVQIITLVTSFRLFRCLLRSSVHHKLHRKFSMPKRPENLHAMFNLVESFEYSPAGERSRIQIATELLDVGPRVRERRRDVFSLSAKKFELGSEQTATKAQSGWWCQEPIAIGGRTITHLPPPRFDEQLEFRNWPT